MGRNRKLELLEKALSEVQFRNKMNKVMDRIADSISSGFAKEKILNSIKGSTEYPVELFDFAKSRISVRKKFSKWNRLWLDSYSSSYSTPEYVGKYRSERLSGSRIYDLGAGAGMQSVMFSMNSEVTAVERDRERIAMAQLNALVYKQEIEFLRMDVFDLLNSRNIDQGSVVFSDPLRIRDGSGNVVLDPDIPKIKEKFGNSTDRFAFDLPPRTPVSRISTEDEAEYISLSGNLVRLTQYSSAIAESQSSAVIFPSGRIFRGDRRDTPFSAGDSPKYISVPDVAIVSSKLEYVLNDFGEFYVLQRDHRRLMLGSDRQPDENFPGAVYSIMETGPIDQIRNAIRREKPSKLYLRYPIEPGKYYSTAEELNDAPGSGVPLYMFHLKEGYSLCSRIA